MPPLFKLCDRFFKFILVKQCLEKILVKKLHEICVNIELLAQYFNAKFKSEAFCLQYKLETKFNGRDPWQILIWKMSQNQTPLLKQVMKNIFHNYAEKY